VRLLVDANLLPCLLPLLAEAGHDVAHVFDLGLGEASDETILPRALAEERVVVTADTDFVTIPALTGGEMPSVVLVRRESGRRVHELVALLVANVAPLDAEVHKGCIVVVETDRVRVRSLPIERRAPRKTRGNPRTGRHEPALLDPPHPS
jgi:predicted nuclease of predicted toxin-antitoxin system